MAERQLTGKHAAAIFIGAFGVIIAVNITLAVHAVRSFPGLEVRNSYIASQHFDADRATQQALGWTVQARADQGRIRLFITDQTGSPVRVGSLNAVIGRPTHIRDDKHLPLVFDGQAYSADAVLAPGAWNIRLKATAPDGTAFRQRIVLTR